MTVQELADLYTATHLQNRSSLATTKRLIRNTFELIRDKTIQELSRREILRWHASLGQTPGQANKALSVFRTMVRWGITLELCTNDPTHGVRRFPSQWRSRYLSQEEIQHLRGSLNSAPQKLRLFILLTLMTGCRRSEALTMKWTDLDLSAGRWTKPKAKSGKFHVVPLSQQLIDQLKQEDRTSIYVFSGMNEKHWSAPGVEKAWGKFRAACGLADVRLHDLRRTTASQMVIHGENLTTVQHMLDHSSLQPTAIYARLNVDALAKALQRHADRIYRRDQCSPNATT